MKNILRKMRMTKILKINEFVALNENLANNIHVQELVKENISARAAEPLYESNVPQPDKAKSAIIALPYTEDGNVTIDGLTETISQYIQSQHLSDGCGFSIGHYFAGEYKSEKSVWNEKSLCASLVGEISDRAGTIATAVQILTRHNLPRVLVLNETSALEITRYGSEVKPLPQHRIKRIGE